jgi:transposase
MSRKTDAVVARTIGIDTGKNTLHLIGLDDNGAIVLREKVSRGRIAARLTNVPQCLIGIEAGMATHYVARELIALGHDVKQVPTSDSARLCCASASCADACARSSWATALS